MEPKRQSPNPDSVALSNGGFRLEACVNGWQVGRFEVFEKLGIPHLVTTRRGPDVIQVRDDTGAAALETARVLGAEDAAFLEQVHGGDVLLAERGGQIGRADGLVTTTPSLVLVGKSADCPIVLIADRDRRAVGFAHASWRATVAQIVPAVVQAMVDVGCAARRLVACICPSAGPECYEVGDEVRTAAIEGLGTDAAAFFHPGSSGRDHFDLWAANADALHRAGLAVDSIHGAGICTLCRNEWFPSYRKEGDSAGRFAAAIGIGPEA